MRRIDVLFVAFGVFAGCATYELRSSELGPDAGGFDASSGDSDVGDGDGNAEVGDATFELAVPDSPPPVDASGERPPIDAAGCMCDCDKDLFIDKNGLSCIGSSQGDCDDLDPRAFPDAGFRVDQPTAQTLGDWSCDGLVSRQYNVNVDCASLHLGFNCGNVEGFTADPGCGQSGPYVTCRSTAAADCAVGTTGTRTQGCR